MIGYEGVNNCLFLYNIRIIKLFVAFATGSGSRDISYAKKKVTASKQNLPQFTACGNNSQHRPPGPSPILEVSLDVKVRIYLGEHDRSGRGAQLRLLRKPDIWFEQVGVERGAGADVDVAGVG